MPKRRLDNGLHQVIYCDAPSKVTIPACCDVRNPYREVMHTSSTILNPFLFLVENVVDKQLAILLDLGYSSVENHELLLALVDWHQACSYEEAREAW
jgi:hypothetical protein